MLSNFIQVISLVYSSSFSTRMWPKLYYSTVTTGCILSITRESWERDGSFLSDFPRRSVSTENERERYSNDGADSGG